MPRQDTMHMPASPFSSAEYDPFVYATSAVRRSTNANPSQTFLTNCALRAEVMGLARYSLSEHLAVKRLRLESRGRSTVEKCAPRHGGVASIIDIAAAVRLLGAAESEWLRAGGVRVLDISTTVLRAEARRIRLHTQPTVAR